MINYRFLIGINYHGRGLDMPELSSDIAEEMGL